jgi:5-methyltetrahydropteroyltriglutamate--homocysteine methyltransferase
MPNTVLGLRADHVGSLLRPTRLIEQRYAPDREHDPIRLNALEDECIREVVALQEEVGLEVITDGEYRRGSWRSGFIGHVDGLVNRVAQAEVNKRGFVDMGSFIMDAAPFTEGKLKRASGIATEEFKFLRSATSRVAKVSLPAPSFMHFFAGENAVNRSVYASLDSFYADLTAVYVEEIAELAALGATYVQLDDAPLGFLCDIGIRARMASAGINADEWIDLYVEMLNTVIVAAPKQMMVAVHICRGNSMGKAGGAGSFEPMAKRVFNRLIARRLFLEFDEPHNGDLSPLRYIPDDKTVVLGLISTKTPVLESVDRLKTRIREATSYIPLERLCISPQCGFASRDKGTSLTQEDELAKLRLLVKVARNVWN